MWSGSWGKGMDASGGLCVQAYKAGYEGSLIKVHWFLRPPLYPRMNWLTAFTPRGDLQSTLFLLCF